MWKTGKEDSGSSPGRTIREPCHMVLTESLPSIACTIRTGLQSSVVCEIGV